MILHASTILLRALNTPDMVLYERAMRKIMRFSWMSDRTETLVTPLKQYMPEEYKIPTVKPVGTFEDVLQSRCLQLANTDKHLYLQWSGGIDSTLMVISFLKSDINLDQITIVMNRDSIKENPTFYYTYILPKFRLLSIEKHLSEDNDGITIQAEHADQIISGMMLSRIDKSWTTKPATKTNLYNVCAELGFDKIAAEAFINAMLKTGKSSPRPIDTIEDFSWWFNFNFRWLNAKEKYKPRLGYNKEFDTFYSSHDIQRWSILNKSPDKSLYKDLIYNYTKDKDYHIYKRKWQSMGKLFFTNKPDMIISVSNSLQSFYKPFDTEFIKQYYVEDNDFCGYE